MTSFWDERYSDTEFVYGKDPNVFFAENLDLFQPANYFFRQKVKAEMQFSQLKMVVKFSLGIKVKLHVTRQCYWHRKER